MKGRQAVYLKDYAALTGLDEQWKAFEALYAHAEAAVKAGKLEPFIGLKPKLGKLSVKEEPGKKRIIALVDPVTQWFLYPLHKWIFSILRTIKQDATFDQNAGLEYARSVLRRKKLSNEDLSVFSYDLSSATDRLPVILQILLLNEIQEGFGNVWARILIDRDYYVPQLKKSVRYKTGQPMGAFSS